MLKFRNVNLILFNWFDLFYKSNWKIWKEEKEWTQNVRWLNLRWQRGEEKDDCVADDARLHDFNRGELRVSQANEKCDMRVWCSCFLPGPASRDLIVSVLVSRRRRNIFYEYLLRNAEKNISMYANKRDPRSTWEFLYGQKTFEFKSMCKLMLI